MKINLIALFIVSAILIGGCSRGAVRERTKIGQIGIGEANALMFTIPKGNVTWRLGIYSKSKYDEKSKVSFHIKNISGYPIEVAFEMKRFDLDSGYSSKLFEGKIEDLFDVTRHYQFAIPTTVLKPVKVKLILKKEQGAIHDGDVFFDVFRYKLIPSLW